MFTVVNVCVVVSKVMIISSLLYAGNVRTGVSTVSNVVEKKKKIVRERKRKDRELTIARKEVRRTHARNGGRW